MSSTIKSKFDQHIQRHVSQHTTERKSELTSRHVNELKTLGKSIKESKEAQRAMSNSLHAVNHIKTRSAETETGEDKIETTPNPENTRLYTRQGKHENLEEGNEKLYKQQTNELAQAEDEFYHIKDRGNTITEDTTGYYIEAYAPEHEKAGVRVSISNDKAVIFGSRKAQNEEEHSRGKIVTNNFQSFREEFNLGNPVSTKGMTRERDGDYMRFFIPKLGTNAAADDGSSEES
jgi:HSP20 family molecular chaperone IbpA